MNIAIDSEIFAYRDFFCKSFCRTSKIEKIISFNGRTVTNKDLLKTDALFVRSVTCVDKTLLKNTPIRFVATATSGTEHLDLEYLKQKNIFFCSSHGANADAVVQYVLTSLFIYCDKKKKKAIELSIAIIGCGKVGNKLTIALKKIGMKVYSVDPFVKDCLEEFPFQKDIDIVSFHCSLTKGEDHPTYHYVNQKFLEKIKKKITIINASRGDVLDEKELLNSKKVDLIFNDVWKNEPYINQKYLERCQLATPHIAGYTIEAKLNATNMVYYSFCQYFSFDTYSSSFSSSNLLKPFLQRNNNTTKDKIIRNKKNENQIKNLIEKKKNQKQKKYSINEIKKYINFEKNNFDKKIKIDFLFQLFSVYQQDHYELLNSINEKKIAECFDNRRKIITERRQFFKI